MAQRLLVLEGGQVVRDPMQPVASARQLAARPRRTRCFPQDVR
jgi:hypothetical protein